MERAEIAVALCGEHDPVTRAALGGLDVHVDFVALRGRVVRAASERDHAAGEAVDEVLELARREPARRLDDDVVVAGIIRDVLRSGASTSTAVST